MAILSSLFSDMSTSLGMSPIVAIYAGGIDNASDNTATTRPLTPTHLSGAVGFRKKA